MPARHKVRNRYCGSYARRRYKSLEPPSKGKMKIADLTTGTIREPRPGTADGDMALAGAHGRPDLDREIERQIKRMKAEKAAREKAESRQFVADRKTAKALLEAHGEDLMHYAYVHWQGEEEPTLPKMRKWLKSEAWFNPRVVMDLAERMKREGKL